MLNKRQLKFWIPAAVLLVAILASWIFSGRKLPDSRWLAERWQALLPANTTSPTVGHDHGAAAQADEHDHDHGHGEHVDISAVAAASLGLRVGPLTASDYTKSIHIPAAIVEKPGQSGMAVTSPIQGIITRVACFPGQALDPNGPLFTIQVTDEALEAAQLSLLDILTRITVTEREIERLDPLAESGAVVGRRKLEMEYQLKTLQSEQAARLQELRLRGLSPTQIDAITEQRELVSEIEVGLDAATTVSMTEAKTEAADLIYTVEQLNVYPGKSVRKGEELCHIANHRELYVRGEAFETDVPALRQAMQQGLGLTLEWGVGAATERLTDLPVTYMDNHVDTRTQTYPFYVAVPNRVVSEQQDAAGRWFRSWQFKPGQRVHLYVPQETWQQQWVLPRTAVVSSGAESYVFRLEPTLEEIAFERSTAERLERLPQRKDWAVEPVAVRVLHQDRQHVVLGSESELMADDLVLLDNAYQIWLAWKIQTSGGGGGHTHEH